MRQQVLRPGRPAAEVFFEGDLEKDTFHLGYFDADEIVGVTTCVHRKNAFFDAPFQYQLRGMAVLPASRGQDLGKALLLEAEKILKDTNPEALLWFNAREVALGFYEKFGYRTIGDLFMIPNVCMHVVMYKKLK